MINSILLVLAFQSSLNAWFYNEGASRSEEHTSELQSRSDLVCRLLLEKKKKKNRNFFISAKKKTLKRSPNLEARCASCEEVQTPHTRERHSSRDTTRNTGSFLYTIER